MKKNLKRVASFVIALGVALSSAASISAADFSDVPGDSNYAEAVSGLSSIGILTGYEDGTFKPDSNITRAEVAAVVVRALAQESAAVSSKGATAFTDVSADHWASGYVNVASSGNNAFINGMGDGTFAPDANVTYAQIIKMLVAGIGYGDWGVSYGGYPTGYITAAKNLGITNGVSTVNADEPATRGTVAKLTYNAVNTPLLALETYSPTNPEYIVLDGADGRAYETPLTYYHNIYTVEGRITATNKSESGAYSAGEVMYRIENTKNFGEDGIVVSRSYEETFDQKMYILADSGINPDAYLNVYSKALVYVDENEEATLISITASAKNQSIELDARGWDDEEFGSEEAALDAIFDNTRPQIYFYSDASKKGKSSRYYLSLPNDGDATFKLYVNGVLVDSDEENVRKYIFNNDVGTVTLVDTPEESKVSTDGRYDAIYVTYYKSAEVDSLTSNRMYFDNAEEGMTSDIKFEWDDDDYEYTFLMDGKEIKYEEIKEGDIVSIAYNVDAKTEREAFKDSNFYTIIVSRNTAEGKANELNTDDGEVGVGDGSYPVINGLSGTKEDGTWSLNKYFTLGSTYTLYLDAFDRVVSYEKSASSRKYAIVINAYTELGTGEGKLRICDATGTLKTLDVDDKLLNTDKWTTLVNDKSVDNNLGQDTVTDGNGNVWATIDNLNNVQNRVITYETNTSGEVKNVEFKNANLKNGSYKKSSNKLAGLSIGESTIIIGKDDSGKNDFDLVNKSSLINDNDYIVAGFKDSGDDDYAFVLILDGVGSYNEDTRFAVVDKKAMGSNENGDDCYKITLYNADEKTDSVTLNTEDMTVIDTNDENGNSLRNLDKGDVIVYKLNASNEIKEITLLMSVSDLGSNETIKDFVDNYKNSNVWSENYRNRIGAWKNSQSYDDRDADIVFGPIIDKTTNGVTIVKASDLESDSDGEFIYESNVDEYGYDSDVAVYIYDLNNSKSERLYKGSTSSITKGNIPSASYKDPDNDDKAYIVDADVNRGVDFPIAFAKVVDNKTTITDILVIIPKED